MDGSPMSNVSPHVSQMQPPQGSYSQPPSMSMVQQQQQLQLMQAQQQAAAAPADSDKILRLFIRDYLAAHNFHSTAAALTKEAELPGPAPRPPQDAQQPPPPTTQQVCAQLGIQLPALPAGGLEEWWHIFNEIFSAVRGDQKSGVVVDMVRAQNERMTQRSQAQKATVVQNMNGMTQLAMNMNPMAAAAAAAAAAVQQPALQIQLQPPAQIAPGPGPGPGPRPMAPPQQPLLTPNTFATNAHLMSQSIHALGLAGRDPKTFTQEERQRIMERTMRTQQQSVQAQQAQQMSMQQQQQLGQQQRVQLHQQHQQQMQHQAAQAQMAQLQQQQLALQHHQQQIQHALQQQALQQGGGAHGQGGQGGMGVDLKTTNQQLAELQARQAAVLRRQQEQLKRRLSAAPQSAETSPAATGPPAPGQGQGQGQVAPSPVVGNMPGPGQGGNVGGGAGQTTSSDSNTASANNNGNGDGNEGPGNETAQQNNQPQPPANPNSSDSQATQNQNLNPFAMEWPNADTTDASAFDASDLFDFGDNDNEEGENSGEASNGAQVASADWNAGLPTGMTTGDSFGGFDFGDMGGDINFENFA